MIRLPIPRGGPHTILVRSGRGPERAVDAAKKRLAKLEPSGDGCGRTSKSSSLKTERQPR